MQYVTIENLLIVIGVQFLLILWLALSRGYWRGLNTITTMGSHEENTLTSSETFRKHLLWQNEILLNAMLDLLQIPEDEPADDLKKEEKEASTALDLR